MLARNAPDDAKIDTLTYLADGDDSYEFDANDPDAEKWRMPANFPDWDQVFPPHHILYFTEDSMTRFLDRHGLDVIRFVWSLKPALKVPARER